MNGEPEVRFLPFFLSFASLRWARGFLSLVSHRRLPAITLLTLVFDFFFSRLSKLRYALAAPHTPGHQRNIIARLASHHYEAEPLATDAVKLGERGITQEHQEVMRSLLIARLRSRRAP